MIWKNRSLRSDRQHNLSLKMQRCCSLRCSISGYNWSVQFVTAKVFGKGTTYTENQQLRWKSSLLESCLKSCKKAVEEHHLLKYVLGTVVGRKLLNCTYGELWPNWSCIMAREASGKLVFKKQNMIFMSRRNVQRAANQFSINSSWVVIVVQTDGLCLASKTL